ncbi:MAG: FtsX-like permease family protein [Propionibacteriaceae bacterium]|jgi:hypothetical protein|nr:FtsX-like permease family protein [Propionibacteriaceae bacterium]
MSVLALSRLLLTQNRGDRLRLAGIAGGVAIGVLLTLLLWAGYTSLAERSERSTWTDPDRQSEAVAHYDAEVGLTDGEAAVRCDIDYYRGRPITVLRIAANPGTTVRVPGVAAVPAAGESFVSPALRSLIDSTPSDLLGDRYGAVLGTVSDTALAGPDSLVAVVGVEPAELGNLPRVVTQLRGTAYATVDYQIVAIIGAVAVLVPVIVLLAVVTALGSAKRAERLATLRLIGATPRTVALLSAVETATTSAFGAAAGVVAAWLAAPLAARIQVAGARFFPDDLRSDPAATLVVAVGIIVLATVVAAIRAVLTDVGPLGAARERRERPPRVWGLLPLAAGLVVLAFVIAQIAPAALAGHLVIGGFILTVVGLLAAGPLLTRWAARLAAPVARGAVGVIAVGRIREHPRQTFRSVSGIVIAVFLASTFAGGATTVGRPDLAEGPDYLASSTLFIPLGTDSPTDDPALLAQIDRLREVRGVQAVAVLGWSYSGPDGQFLSGTDAAALGHPVPGDTARVDDGLPIAPFTPTPATRPADLIATQLLVSTSDADAIERARTALPSIGIRTSHAPSTRAESITGGTTQTWAGEYAVLANLGILVATLISALALAVSALAGMLDRLRVLGLLRLTGMPLRTLRGILTAEAALPLAGVLLAAAGLGWYAAWVIVSGLTRGRRRLDWPGLDYYLILALSVALSALAILATFRTARTSTSTTTIRFE